MEDVPGWAQLVDMWFELEETAGFLDVGKGKGLPTSKDCPKAVATWIQNGQSNKPVEIDTDMHGLNLMRWWKALNPSWCKVYQQEGEGDWGSLNASGHNGLLSILACMHWWYLADKSVRSDVGWQMLFTDAQWVLGCLVKEAGEPQRKKSKNN
ncbi:hypothetical protein BT96DRAFT_838392 [Gymnopus androsaceus JB14]|uniref:Uncharacterized protein n=1 Tax=Gymnopus androsaceus JB14 TaxID=1447944 RepID=A0A6A4GMH4_9AGAR|nr:hypothetical protein BT96DRAFT_838392 [Gymnopus androsaceus JB14]